MQFIMGRREKLLAVREETYLDVADLFLTTEVDGEPALRSLFRFCFLWGRRGPAVGILWKEPETSVDRLGRRTGRDTGRGAGLRAGWLADVDCQVSRLHRRFGWESGRRQRHSQRGQRRRTGDAPALDIDREALAQSVA